MPDKTYPQQNNVLSNVEYLLRERGIDITFTDEEKEELYKAITQCVSRHYLDKLQGMMTDRLGIDCYTSRSMLDKMYHALDKDEKEILEEFNEKIGYVQYYQPEGKENAIKQLRRIMRGKHWKDSFMDGADYTYCDGIISYMDNSTLREFQQFMNKLEQTDNEIRYRNIQALGNIEDKQSILIYLGEYEADNQQDFYHRIRRETKDYLKLDKDDGLETILTKCEEVIKQMKKEYRHVAVSGEGYWASVANLIAHRYDTPAMLINPLLDHTLIEFPMTNLKDVEIILERPNEITKFPILDSWHIHYLWMREFEVLRNIDWAMSRACWDNWSYVDINKRYGDFHR